MADLIAYAIFLILTGVALVHLYWAFGGSWPGHDETSLARAVVGTKGLDQMPSRPLTMLVACLIFVAGSTPFLKTGLVATPLPAWLVTVCILGLAAIFTLRGALTYTPIARKMNFEEPFQHLNKIYYSPLCLLLGMGFIGIASIS